VYGNVHKTRKGDDFSPRQFFEVCDFEVIAIAGSAGGIAPLKSLLTELPEDFPCPIVIVQHLPPVVRFRSALDQVLGRCTNLTVKWAEQGEALRAGTILLAPQDHHLEILKNGRISLSDGREVNRCRPAADPLFRSIAAHYGQKAIAVILSGALYDGAMGACEVARAGGRVLVQSRETAEQPDMPHAAICAGAVDFEFSPRIIARTLIALAMARGAAAWFQVSSEIRLARATSAALF
jgi:two-component system chemotaxis response regulator CheB